jgi:dihydroxy-acid dehydratase
VADLCVPESDLELRRQSLGQPAPPQEKGWLRIYQRLVRPLPEGAVLRERGTP